MKKDIIMSWSNLIQDEVIEIIVAFLVLTVQLCIYTELIRMRYMHMKPIITDLKQWDLLFKSIITVYPIVSNLWYRFQFVITNW